MFAISLDLLKVSEFTSHDSTSKDCLQNRTLISIGMITLQSDNNIQIYTPPFLLHEVIPLS
jgi:hypothetical protein